MSERCVVMLAGAGPSTNILYHGLRAALPGDVRMEVVIENAVPKSTLLKRRIQRLGVVEVTGQLMFMALVVPALRLRSRRRTEQIAAEAGLNDGPIDIPVHRVSSVNTPEARELLQTMEPDVVVINGTRIIGRETLQAIAAPTINTHAGITPAYRGVHGGYWALAEGRPDLVGTTVHRVDEGIDTGEIIDQATFTITSADTFVTYPYLHTAAGLPMLVGAVTSALNGSIPSRLPDPELPSSLRYHPTIWAYARAYLKHGAR